MLVGSVVTTVAAAVAAGAPPVRGVRAANVWRAHRIVSAKNAAMTNATEVVEPVRRDSPANWANVSCVAHNAMAKSVVRMGVAEVVGIVARTRSASWINVSSVFATVLPKIVAPMDVGEPAEFAKTVSIASMVNVLAIPIPVRGSAPWVVARVQ